MAKTVSALLFMVPPLFGTALSAWKILHKYLNEIFEWKKEGLFLYSNNLLFTCLQPTPFICCFLLPFCFSLLPESLRSFPPYQISLLAPHCLWSPLLTPRLQLLPTGSLFMFLSLNCLEEKNCEWSSSSCRERSSAWFSDESSIYGQAASGAGVQLTLLPCVHSHQAHVAPEH